MQYSTASCNALSAARHFEVRFVPVERSAESVRFSYNTADGRIVVALCETSEEHQEALHSNEYGKRHSRYERRPIRMG